MHLLPHGIIFLLEYLNPTIVHLFGFIPSKDTAVMNNLCTYSTKFQAISTSGFPCSSNKSSGLIFTQVKCSLIFM